MHDGDAIDECGLLVREGGAFYLRRDAGGRYQLTLRRVPVDEVQKQVRVIGLYAGEDRVDVEGISLLVPNAQPSR